MLEEPRWSGKQTINQTGHVWGNAGSYQQPVSASWKSVAGPELEQAGGLRLSPWTLFCKMVGPTWVLPAAGERTRKLF